jgi:hypothetical protein
MGDSQQASQRAAANTAAEQSAREQYINSTQQEALAQQEEAEGVSQRVMATQKELSEKMATARVSAGEAGVSGLSVDSLMANYIRDASTANQATLRQQQLDALQGTMRNKGYRAQYQGLVNGLPVAQQPSFASLALGLATGAAGSLASSARVDSKTGDVKIPGLSFLE